MTIEYAPGRVFRVPGDTLTLKLGAAQTGGALSLFESRTHPGDGPPLHVHRREDETFVLLEGRFQFVANGAARQAGPGETIHIPRGVPHSFRNLGPGPGRMYILLTPGGAESFFDAFERLASGGPNALTPQALGDLAAKHGVEFLPPSA